MAVGAGSQAVGFEDQLASLRRYLSQAIWVTPSSSA